MSNKPRVSTEKEIQELLEATEILNRINRLDTSTLSDVVRREGTPLEQYVRALEEDDKVLRKELQHRDKKRKKKKKQHWKTKQKYQREYHLNVRGPRRRARLAARLLEEGWYPRMVLNWKGNQHKIELTADEWQEHIAPLLGDDLPAVYRIDTSKGIALDNVVVKVRGTGELIFDGGEYALQKMGFALPDDDRPQALYTIGVADVPDPREHGGDGIEE